jgi:hypothetical protein
MQTERTKISRMPKRGNYEPEVINPILDEALFCTIAYSIDNQPFQIPTGFCRIQDKIYIHGSVGSHFLREIVKGIPVCISVTHLDGLVLARSAFHHSVNYRSVVIFSKAELVDDEELRWKVLEEFTEKVMKGRWNDVIQPNEKDMQKTMILGFSIEEASAKIRTGNAKDEEEDMDSPYWAGLVPIKQVMLTPEPDPLLKKGIPLPNYLEKIGSNF